jgi:hypothetical protein
MKSKLFFALLLLIPFNMFAQTDITQNGINTTVINGISANGPQAIRYEIARVSYNSHHWQWGGIVTIELFNRYFATGYEKYLVEIGFGQGTEDGAPRIQLVESRGISHNAQLCMGSAVDLQTDIGGFINRAIPVYLDVKYYSSYNVRITYQQDKVTDLTANNQIKISQTPVGSSTADFTAPSARLEVNGNGYFGGNVGIGTTSPSNNFEVVGSNSTTLEAAGFYNTYSYDKAYKAETRINLGKIEDTRHQPMGAIGAFPSSNDDSSNGNLVFYTRNTQNLVERLRIDKDGNVGIGTGTGIPAAKLEVYNSAQAGHLVLSGNDNPSADMSRIDLDYKIATANQTIGRISSAYLTSANGGSGALRFFTSNNGVLAEKMRIGNTGNVSIGTKATNPTDELLTVFGVIHAKEVQVDLTGSLADYVFHPNYKLMPLTQVEQYVKTNSHLPEIPSAAEVSKNGMSMGEMQNKLLQKVEELTLYVIEQQKRIEQLEKNQK